MEKSTLETLKYKLFCHNWYGSPLSLFLLLNVLTYYWDNWERLHLWYALDWNQGQTTITQCLTWNICCLQMVKFWGVLGKFSQKAYLLGDSWNSASRSMPARTQIFVEEGGMGNMTNFDHHCTASANTNISTKEVPTYSRRKEREGGLEEGNELIHSWPSNNIQIPSKEIIYFPQHFCMNTY